MMMLVCWLGAQSRIPSCLNLSGDARWVRFTSRGRTLGAPWRAVTTHEVPCRDSGGGVSVLAWAGTMPIKQITPALVAEIISEFADRRALKLAHNGTVAGAGGRT